MSFPIGDPEKIRGYHAHIYYDDATRAVAARLRQDIWAKFDVVMGRFRDTAVGPHPEPMYQVEFRPNQLGEFLPWLMTHRDGLTVLVHPNTGNAYEDHCDWPLWLGGKLDLRLDFLRSGRRSA